MYMDQLQPSYISLQPTVTRTQMCWTSHCWRLTLPLKCAWLSWIHSASSSWGSRYRLRRVSLLVNITDWNHVTSCNGGAVWSVSHDAVPVCRPSCALITATVHSWRRCLKSTCVSCGSTNQRRRSSRSSPRCAPSFTRCVGGWGTALCSSIVHGTMTRLSPPLCSSPARFSKAAPTCVPPSAMRSSSVATPSWAPFAMMPPTFSTSSWRATLTTRAANRSSGLTYRCRLKSLNTFQAKVTCAVIIILVIKIVLLIIWI